MYTKIDAISFKLGTFCNLDCEYCYQKQDVKTVDTKFKMIPQLVNFLSNPDLPLDKNFFVFFSGGEPSLQTELMMTVINALEPVSYFKELDISYGTISNGTLIYKIIDLAHSGKLNPNECGISWDGIHSNSKSRHSKLEKYDDEYFNNIIRDLGKDDLCKDKFVVRIGITENTIDELSDSFQFALESGCTKIEYYFINYYPDYKKTDLQQRFLEQLDKIYELYKKYKFTWNNVERLKQLEIMKNKDISEVTKCRKLGRNIFIAMNGDILPCALFDLNAVPENKTDYSKYVLGNIEKGFDREKINNFIAQYSTFASCSKYHCGNYNCTECPASNLFKLGDLNKRTLFSCIMRSMERASYHKNKHLINGFNDYNNYTNYDMQYNLNPPLPYFN